MNTVKTILVAIVVSLFISCEKDDLYIEDTKEIKSFDIKISDVNNCKGRTIKVYFEATDFLNNTGNFEEAKTLYLNSAGTKLAINAWYSNGVVSRHWNGKKFVGLVQICL